MGIIYAQASDQLFELARTELYTQMGNLLTAMAADDPKPLAVYNTHYVLKATLPAISVGLNNAMPLEEPSPQSYGGGATTPAIIAIGATLRVLLNWDYEGSYFDEIKCWRLLNSIKNWMYVHKQLGNGFNVFSLDEITVGDDFPESLCIGGTVRIDLRRTSEFTLA